MSTHSQAQPEIVALLARDDHVVHGVLAVLAAVALAARGRRHDVEGGVRV